MDAHFLAFALRDEDQFGRHRHAGRLFEQRANASAQRAAGDIRTAVRILHDRIIRAADFERALARADVQTGLAVHLAFEDQLADQLQFRLCSVSAHCLILVPLFVISDDGFEEIAEPFVAARFVLPRDLQQQPLDLIEAAQSMPRDRVSQARPQHHELVLPFVLGRARRPPHGVVKTPQLAARAGIQIAHAAHHHVRLVIQIQAVADQLFEIDLRRAFHAPVAAGPPIATSVAAAVARTAAPIAPPPGGRPLRSPRVPLATGCRAADFRDLRLP